MVNLEACKGKPKLKKELLQCSLQKPSPRSLQKPASMLSPRAASMFASEACFNALSMRCLHFRFRSCFNALRNLLASEAASTLSAGPTFIFGHTRFIFEQSKHAVGPTFVQSRQQVRCLVKEARPVFGQDSTVSVWSK